MPPLPNFKELLHKYITDTALPYITNSSPIETRPHFVAGSNILTSLYSYMARRPGFATDTVQTFTGKIEREFVWQRWNGARFKMICTTSTTSGASDVWKLQIGTDTTYSQIHTCTTSTTAFDFVVSNNYVYFGNGTNMRKYDGTTVTLWGIAKPAAAPSTAAVAGGAINAVNGGYRWKYAFENSGSGHIGQISNSSAITGNFAGRNYTITGSTTSDAQVTNVRVYRTADAGATWFELPNSPATYSASWSLTDSSTDSQLTTNQASLAGQNAPPPASYGCTAFASRLWTIFGDTVYFSNFEEQLNGVEEESFSTVNYYSFGQLISGGLAVVQKALMIITASSIFRIIGDSLTTFTRQPFLNRMGATAIPNVARGGGRSMAWLDTSGTAYVTDGVGIQEIGMPIRSDLSGIDQSRSSMSFHNAGLQSWLLIQDSGQDKMWPYDTDNGIWMPPWSIGGTAIHSGETATGTYTLLIGRASQPLKLTTNFTDLGSSYTASVTFSLSEICEGKGPGEVGHLEYIALERNSVALSNVSVLLDEDPASGTYQTIFVNEVNPSNRTAGTNVVEKWYYQTTTGTTARRVSTKLDWAAASTEFKVFSIDTITSEDQTAP